MMHEFCLLPLKMSRHVLPACRPAGTFSPQNISNLLHGLVGVGAVPPPELLGALARSAGAMLRSFGPQELTNLVWSLSQLHRAGVAFTQDVEVGGGGWHLRLVWQA
jgi:hypothetical protein